MTIEKLNFIIFGSGKMAEIYALLLKQNIKTKLVAIVGNTEDKTKKLAKKHDCKSYFYGDLKTALKENTNVDAVVIASPEWIRMHPIKVSEAHNKHILYEKPMASSFNEAKQIYEILNSSKNKKITMPIFNLRFSPQYNAVKEKICRNDIGVIRHIISKRNGNNKIVKRIINNISPFFWLSPHEIDLIRWYTNSEVKFVEAYFKYYSTKNDGFLIATIAMQNDAMIQHTVSWCSPEVSPYFPTSSMEIYGNKGVISIEEEKPSGVIFNEGSFVEKIDTSYLPVVNSVLLGPFKANLDHFLETIHLDESSFIKNRDALEAIKVCEAMDLSSKTGKRIYLADLKC